MKSYIVTWTYTVESDSADGAVETALTAMAEGNISPEVEELTDEHCTCDERSWHGIEHDSACLLAGARS